MGLWKLGNAYQIKQVTGRKGKGVGIKIMELDGEENWVNLSKQCWRGKFNQKIRQLSRSKIETEDINKKKKRKKKRKRKKRKTHSIDQVLTIYIQAMKVALE